MFPQNVALSSNYMALKPGATYFSQRPLKEPHIQLTIYNWWMRSLTYVTNASCSLWGNSLCPHERKASTSRLKSSVTYSVSNSLAHSIILRNTCRHCYIVIPWRMLFSCHVDKRQGCPAYYSVVDNYSPQFNMASCTRRELPLLGGSDAGCHFV
jgi:hypothetical protein